ncbi:MAG: translation initiation factor IF-1 [Candidatus Pacebacteria bacterium]|nr:translation initiation factor IF-1 [Candidatus Paceibacterota bacterium]MBP9058130.1 translation initiation factor IF-1 [Candidatus Paceibacterota bacterium]MBP9770112.1 translation initiation factor IF-1 [Candidatus Paceibacterota bacterium]
MSAEESKEYANGVVTEALPNTMFRVLLDESKKELIAYLAGKMRLHRIRVLVGDKVEVLIDPYGGKGRITKRF